jgi:hypothetical protein
MKKLFVTRLRKILFATLAITIALSVVAYAYWKSLPSITGPKVTLTSSPFELSMALDKTEYSLVDNMSVSFYLRNISNETVTLTWPNWPWRPESNLNDEGKFWLTTTAEGVTSSDDTLLYQGLQFGYILTDSNGTVIENNPNRYVIIPSTYSIDFEPNASIIQTLTIDLAQYVDDSFNPLQQGTYQISATLHAYLNERGNFTGSLTWETPSIAFAIAQHYWKSLPSTTGPEVTITSSPFELSMALDKTTYSLDGNMTIMFYLRTISNETVTVVEPSLRGVSPTDPAITLATASEGFSTSYNIAGENPLGSSLLPFSYTLVASNGTVIDEFPSRLAVADVYSIYFEPGASLNQTLYVNLTEYSTIHTAPTGHPIQTGTYRISAALEGGFNSAGTSTLETPSIAFTIEQ